MPKSSCHLVILSSGHVLARSQLEENLLQAHSHGPQLEQTPAAPNRKLGQGSAQVALTHALDLEGAFATILDLLHAIDGAQLRSDLGGPMRHLQKDPLGAL